MAENDRRGAQEGSDATTGAEVGIGSQTTAGEIDGQGYGFTSGANPAGADGAPIGNETLGEEPGVPTNAGNESIDQADGDPTVTPVASAGTGIPPRAPNGGIEKDASGTLDADRVREIQSGKLPDAGFTSGGKP